MSSGAVLDITMRYIMRMEGGVEEFGVLIFDDRIVETIHEEDRWAVVGYMFLDRERIAFNGVKLPPYTQGTPSGAAMGILLMAHSDDGIDRTQESWFIRGAVMGEGHHSEMSSRREAHDADARGINMQRVRMRVGILQRPLYIGEHVRVFIPQTDDAVTDTVSADRRYAILEDKRIDSLLIEPLRHLASFMYHIMPAITPPRADDNRHTGIDGTIGRIVGQPLRLGMQPWTAHQEEE